MKWSRVMLPVVFEEFEVVSIFLAIFFFSLYLSIGNRSTLAKILGTCSPPSPPGCYGPDAEKDLMKSHLKKDFNDIRNLRLEYNTVKDKLKGEIGPIFAYIMLKSISKSLQRERLESFRTKKKKLFNLTKRRTKGNVDYKVPIINLSNYQLNEKEYDQLKMGLIHCFISKDKNIKKHMAVNIKSIAYINSDKVDQTDSGDSFLLIKTFIKLSE